MYYQLFLQPRSLPRDALFRPIITQGTSTSLLETDYNLHKSNSTYFADLDIGRSMLISALLRRGIRGQGREMVSTSTWRSEKEEHKSVPGASATLQSAVNSVNEVATAETTLRTPHTSSSSSSDSPPGPSQTAKPSDRFLIALGGVSCHFKCELKPYEPYEIWTRILSWDRKWIYLVSHIVRAGAAKPDSYALGHSPSIGERIGAAFGVRGGWGRTLGADKAGGAGEGKQVNGALRELQKEQREEWQKHIFASSIAKYVVKKGRLTIAPEVVWGRSDLLPTGSEGTESGNPTTAWTPENVEKERLRGLQLAENFAALDGLVGEFPSAFGEEGGEQLHVLGEFQDWAGF